MEINRDTSYMIGLFQTDGSMSLEGKNKGRFRLELSSKDEDIVHKIKDLIPYNYHIRKRTRKTKVNNREYNNETIQLTVHSLEFRNFLVNCGIPYGLKSKIIKPPLHLPNLSIPDYVRGLYDGDGSLGMTTKDYPFMSFATDSDDIATFLTNYICEVTGKSLKIMKRNNRDDIYNIGVMKEDAIILSNEVYYKGCLSLDRKYMKAEEVRKWERPTDMKFGAERKWWTKDQDEYILNHTIEESMEYLDRTEDSIEMRLWRLKSN